MFISINIQVLQIYKYIQHRPEFNTSTAASTRCLSTKIEYAVRHYGAGDWFTSIFEQQKWLEGSENDTIFLKLY